MSWRVAVADKLMSPEDAVSVVESGHAVAVAAASSTPTTLCSALFQRRHQLSSVRIDHPGSFFPWVRDEENGPFHVFDAFGTAMNRAMINDGRVGYIPMACWRENETPVGFVVDPDVFLVPISPPDADGYCSFGDGVWFSAQLCMRAKTVVAEVHDDFIRTGGDNRVHISRIDRLCEARSRPARLALPPRSDEEKRTVGAICTLVATELVRDRDTLQIGTGRVSGAMARYLGDKNDLGFQSELITRGVPRLVRDGVVTGKYKTSHACKAVASACAPLSAEELAIVDGNSAFELFDFGYTDDLRALVGQDNLVAINNALLVDLTGQVTAETVGHRIWSGAGGQSAFMMAARYSRGGRSIAVLPSCHSVNGARVSRIVSSLPLGTTVTVPRTFVDYVVTEYGIATLRGKSMAERVGELLAIVHPDFRSTLEKEAARDYGVETPRPPRRN